MWAAPFDLEVEATAELVRAWEAEGGDPAASPFDPSSDVAWFYRELRRDVDRAEVKTDAEPDTSTRPIWLMTDDPPPARVVAIRMPSRGDSHAMSHVLSLAAKYDLVVFDPRTQGLMRPLEEMAEQASATFWPAGAAQAAVGGAGGAIAAIVAWILSIPILSGLVVLAGGFMAVMAVYTFVAEGRRRLARREG